MPEDNPPAVSLGPLPDVPHIPSISAVVIGSSFDSASAGTTPDGSALLFDATGLEGAWAMYSYGLSERHLPIGLSFVAAGVSVRFWVALSDYGETGDWEWHGPFVDSGEIRPWLNGSKYVSPTGNMHWVIAVEANGGMDLARSAVHDTTVTYVNTAGVGDIAVRVDEPEAARYPEGAPIVVSVAGWFTSSEGFTNLRSHTDIGGISVSCLWPGNRDLETGARSQGIDDHAGPDSLAALRDAIRFAGGLTPDIDGNYIDDLTSVPALTANVGVYAFSHPGVAATNVLAYFGDDLSCVSYLVGRENPTSDEHFALEIGYWDESGSGAPFEHPYYEYPADYDPLVLDVDFSTATWVVDADHPDGWPGLVVPGDPVYVFGSKGPELWGKRTFSRKLTHALEDNNVFGVNPWPAWLATPLEADTAWPSRVAVGHYPAIGAKLPGLKVMLVFAADDHVQTAPDKPHVHQAWDGFTVGAGLSWVRLNPDLAYLETYSPGAGGYTEHPANAEPGDWLDIRQWGYINAEITADQAVKAAIAEMADRVRLAEWGDNLAGIL